MNPIVYNKNGQYRFTDFVGYLPEFLRSEPDVVTFMQVLSDYINNAYRNVETTEEFELIKVCTSTDCKVVMKRMEHLAEMFRMACDRGEAVMYLSVPRNNIKSNITVGNANAEYERDIEVDLDEISDTIGAATQRVGTELNDGDVVYVTYGKRPLKEKVAYYYVKERNILSKDSMCSSQDPFTGTYNDPATAIEFKLSEVGKVIRRYGYTEHVKDVEGNLINEIIYYEVCLPIHITDLKRVPSSSSSMYDVNADGIDDRIMVDYYNLSSTVGNAGSGEDTYCTYVKFAGEDGFSWVGDWPTGFFYFRDTSTANLTKLTDDGTMMVADTLMEPSVDRYRINRVEKTSAGMYRIYTDSFPGVYDNATFYIMDGTESVGIYRMNGDITDSTRFDEGTLYIELVNISGTDYGIEGRSNLMLVSIPLAASKYVLDYENSLPVVKWEPEEITSVYGTVIGTSSDMSMYGVDVISNNLVYSGKVIRYGVYTLGFSYDVSNKLYPGMTIASECIKDEYPDIPMAIAKVTDVRLDHNTGICRVTLSRNLDPGIFNDNPSPVVSIYKVTTGYILEPEEFMNSDDSEFAYYKAMWAVDNPISVGDYLKVEVSGRERLLKVENIDDNGDGTGILSFFTNGEFTVNDIQFMTEIHRIVRNDAQINKFKYVRIINVGGDPDNQVVIGAAQKRSYKGSYFSTKYMMAQLDGSDDHSLLRMVTDVVPLELGKHYATGQFVYDHPYVKKVTQEVTVNSDGSMDNTNALVRDYVEHYSVGFKTVENVFMPYGGPVSPLDYEETPNYNGTMSVVREPLYVKKVNDVRLKYGWQQRQYLYYNDDIGVAPMDRSGFMEVYAGNSNSPVDVDLRVDAHLLKMPAMLYGCGTRYYEPDIDSDLVANINEDGSWTVTVKSSGHGLPNGVEISVEVDDPDHPELVDIFSTEKTTAIVVSDEIIQYVTSPSVTVAGIVQYLDADKAVLKYDRSYKDADETDDHLTGYPEEGDIAKHGDDVYLVQPGTWLKLDPTTIITPSTIYCRHNLFDESVTNPTFALSNGCVIKKIIPLEPGVAEIQLSGRIDDFEDGGPVDERRVYIENVNQGVFNGWHSVKEIKNGGIVHIFVDPGVKIDPFIAPVTNRQMTIYAGRWYKYTLKKYDWDKKSNSVSYVTTNRIMEQNGTKLYTKYRHNLSAGDHVIVDDTGHAVYDMDMGKIHTAIVKKVYDDYTVELAESTGAWEDGSTIYRGYVIEDRNLTRLRGEYGFKLGDEILKFRDGDVVIPLSQVCKDEIRGWRVVQNTMWVPLEMKRTFKVDQISVEMQRNPGYDVGDDFDTEAEYRYVTYRDAEVIADKDALRIGYSNARNYHFEHAHVDNLDTTQSPDMEYSSKYDYATVAPRNDMDPAFKGVPDMGYPLAERIERLAYLRDPEVIDFDLIGYLARFMGYDITSASDDISSSNIYRNSKEREAAVREILAHLPQFYALNGTKAGINMLMATFGLVGDLITMWTSTDDPYGKLVRQDDVAGKVDEDVANRNTSNSWVPTPHVVLDIIENDNFNSMLMEQDELTRMKEQIRCCKPINVVFDGIRIVFNETLKMDPKLTIGGAGITDSTFVLQSTDQAVEDFDINFDPCIDDDCSF